MNTFREAVDAMVSARNKHPGLMMRIFVEPHGARVMGFMGNRETQRSVSWLEMEGAKCNVLAICVGDVARNLAAPNKGPQS